jgi:hypothetical protein
MVLLSTHQDSVIRSVTDTLDSIDNIDTRAFQEFMLLEAITVLRAQLYSHVISGSNPTPRVKPADIVKSLDGLISTSQMSHYDYRALPELASYLELMKIHLGTNFGNHDAAVLELKDFLDELKSAIVSARGGGTGNGVFTSNDLTETQSQTLRSIERELKHGKPLTEEMLEELKNLPTRIRYALMESLVETLVQRQYGQNSVHVESVILGTTAMAAGTILISAAIVATPAVAIGTALFGIMGIAEGMKQVNTALDASAELDRINEAVRLIRGEQHEQTGPGLGGR